LFGQRIEGTTYKREQAMSKQVFSIATLLVAIIVSVSIARATDYTFCTDLDHFRVPDTDIVLKSGTNEVCTYMNDVFFAKLELAGFRTDGKTIKEKTFDMQVWLTSKVTWSIVYEVYRNGLGGMTVTVMEKKNTR
jgi:hypothetical protein